MSTASEESPGDGPLRLFIAIDAPSELKVRLREVQIELGTDATGVRWVRPESMHFTLVFLGNVSSTQIPPLAKVMDMVSSDTSSFSCNVAGLGTFGGPRSPRVIWAGISEAPALHAMCSSLCVELRKLHITIEDRAFLPHLTLSLIHISEPTRPY